MIWFKKHHLRLTEAQKKELANIELVSYIETARQLAAQRGTRLAEEDYKEK